jgi:[Skp1-protein]-hydroxyproline N-acetylglucosaminyltransferase
MYFCVLSIISSIQLNLKEHSYIISNVQKSNKKSTKNLTDIDSASTDIDSTSMDIDSSSTDMIFVSIPSYRDPQCLDTVKDLVKNANRPDLLRIVVYQQNDPSDLDIRNHIESIIDKDLKKFKNIAVITDHYTAAKGPNHARYILQKYYSGEEYYLQIDSHMRSIKDWDLHLKNMLELLPDKSVITQYPPIYNEKKGLHDFNKVRSGLYIEGFGKDDRFTRIQSDYVQDQRNYPYISKAWSACFSFSKGTIVNDASYDPYLPFIFFGEELDITTRLFAKGYRFFSPHYTIFLTNFNRKYRRTYWEDIKAYKRYIFEKLSRLRLCKKLGKDLSFFQQILDCVSFFLFDDFVNKDIHKYSAKRSDIAEYCKFADIEDLNRCRMSKKAKTFRRNVPSYILKGK